MKDKARMEQELAKLIESREAFLSYLDSSIPKDEQGIAFDFSQNPIIEAQKVYEYFCKLDYQARKIRGLLVSEFNLSV